MPRALPHPSFLAKVWIVISENLYYLYLLIAWGVPVLFDIFCNRIRPSRRLPSCTAALTNAATYQRLVCPEVDVREVRCPSQSEQHANSTDRATLEVVGKDGKVTSVFAKSPSQNWLVWIMLCIFDPYRNEMNRYANIPLPGVITPKVHCARFTPSQFLLVLENLAVKPGIEMPTIWMEPPCSLDLARRILATFAKVHAAYLGNPPPGVWNDARRPYFGRVTGLLSWYRVHTRICPGVIPPAIVECFTAALWHWPRLRRAWSAASPQALVHGDAHIGNVYLIHDGSAVPKVGLLDFQVVGSEHPMRDVTYFLASSYPKDPLAADEKELIEHWRSCLGEELDSMKSKYAVPSYEECWEQYRVQSFYAMYAFAFSGGIGGGLQDAKQTRILMGRCAAMMERVDAEGALRDILCLK